MYVIEERGYDRKYGEFTREVYKTECLEFAKFFYEKTKVDKVIIDQQTLSHKKLAERNYTEHNTIASTGVKLPCFNVTYDDGYYELCICETDELYSLNDFTVGDVAFDTAFAEIRDIPMFDEFGNLIKEIN